MLFVDAFYHRNNVYPKVTSMAIIVNKPQRMREECECCCVAYVTSGYRKRGTIFPESIDLRSNMETMDRKRHDHRTGSNHLDETSVMGGLCLLCRDDLVQTGGQAAE